jgi:PAS domain S-box-containing protein
LAQNQENSFLGGLFLVRIAEKPPVNDGEPWHRGVYGNGRDHEARMKRVDLASELFRIYLRYDSEQAFTVGITTVAEGFGATIGALFYRNAKGMYKFCLAGTGFPISIPEGRWKKIIPAQLTEGRVRRFRNWTPPGIDRGDEHWIAGQLPMQNDEPGYMFLGRKGMPWSERDVDDFATIGKTVEEIMTIRYNRDLEIRNRHEAEDALKLIQTRMEAFFETSHDTIYTLDSEGRFTSINSAGVRLFGMESQTRIIGRMFQEFTTKTDSHMFFNERILRTGFIDDYEIMIKRPNGDSVYCLESAHAVMGSDGNIVEIQGSIKDISERIKNEKALWSMNFELSKVNQELKTAQSVIVQQEKLASIGQLAAGIAHEINNPLGFLKSNQKMLKTYFTDCIELLDRLRETNPQIGAEYENKNIDYVVTEAKNIFGESDEGFERIRTIVSHLMAFSRSSSADDFELYDVNAGIEATLSVARNELKYVADVTKQFGALPVIEAKKGEINQVILNILVNASQAIASQKREGKGNITIETRATEKTIVISIGDDGPGIPKEIQSRIFDPFFTTKEPGKGTGLGLSISYDIIVTKHGGTLKVESESGKGARFTITLPIHRAN